MPNDWGALNAVRIEEFGFVDVAQAYQRLQGLVDTPNTVRKHVDPKLLVKSRHLSRDERLAYHKPKSDGVLGTESVDVSDIVQL